MKTRIVKISKYSILGISGSIFSVVGLHVLTLNYNKTLCRNNLKNVINSDWMNNHPSIKEKFIRFLFSYNLFPEIEYKAVKGVEIFDKKLILPFGISANLDYSSDVRFNE